MQITEHLETMHRIFGRDPDHKCRNCCNLIVNERDRHYYKCAVYGLSSSEATDFPCRGTACGHYEKPLPDGEYPVYKWARRESIGDMPLKGQMTIWDMEG